MCVFRLYSDLKQRPRSNLLFVLSGGGKLNFFGTKSLLEEANEELGKTGTPRQLASGLSGLSAITDISLPLNRRVTNPVLRLHLLSGLPGYCVT